MKLVKDGTASWRTVDGRYGIHRVQNIMRREDRYWIVTEYRGAWIVENKALPHGPHISRTCAKNALAAYLAKQVTAAGTERGEYPAVTDEALNKAVAS